MYFIIEYLYIFLGEYVNCVLLFYVVFVVLIDLLIVNLYLYEVLVWKNKVNLLGNILIIYFYRVSYI